MLCRLNSAMLLCAVPGMCMELGQDDVRRASHGSGCIVPRLHDVLLRAIAPLHGHLAVLTWEIISWRAESPPSLFLHIVYSGVICQVSSDT